MTAERIELNRKILKSQFIPISLRGEINPFAVESFDKKKHKNVTVILAFESPENPVLFFWDQDKDKFWEASFNQLIWDNHHEGSMIFWDENDKDLILLSDSAQDSFSRLELDDDYNLIKNQFYIYHEIDKKWNIEDGRNILSQGVNKKIEEHKILLTEFFHIFAGEVKTDSIEDLYTIFGKKVFGEDYSYEHGDFIIKVKPIAEAESPKVFIKDVEFSECYIEEVSELLEVSDLEKINAFIMVEVDDYIEDKGTFINEDNIRIEYLGFYQCY